VARLGCLEVGWQVDRLRARLAQQAGREQEAARCWEAAHAALSRIVEDIRDDRLRYRYIDRADRLEVLRHGRPGRRDGQPRE
jgi:hypothetical protein